MKFVVAADVQVCAAVCFLLSVVLLCYVTFSKSVVLSSWKVSSASSPSNITDTDLVSADSSVTNKMHTLDIMLYIHYTTHLTYLINNNMNKFKI